MSIKEICQSRKDIFMVEPKFLREDPGWNVRRKTTEYELGITELMASIEANGVQEPIKVYASGNDTYTVINGHRRLDAVTRLAANGVGDILLPIRIETKGTSESDRIVDMVTLNSGVSLTPVELSTVMKRLLDRGWTQAQIAVKTGYTQVHVDNLLTLAAAPEEMIAMIDRHQIAATTVINAIQTHGTKAMDIITGAAGVAAAEGKAKATPRHIAKVEAERAPKAQGAEPQMLTIQIPNPINWNVVGPKLKELLEGIFNATPGEEEKEAIHTACLYYDQTWLPDAVPGIMAK